MNTNLIGYGDGGYGDGGYGDGGYGGSLDPYLMSLIQALPDNILFNSIVNAGVNSWWDYITRRYAYSLLLARISSQASPVISGDIQDQLATNAEFAQFVSMYNAGD